MARRELVASRSAEGPAPVQAAILTIAEIDAELTAIRARLKASDDEELTPKLYEIADAWLDKRLQLELADAAERLCRDQLASEFADHIAGVRA